MTRLLLPLIAVLAVTPGLLRPTDAEFCVERMTVTVDGRPVATPKVCVPVPPPPVHA